MELIVTNELTFAEVPHDEGKGIREWALHGPGGATNFLLATESGTGLVIGWHVLPGPDEATEAVPCDLVPGGFCRQGVTYIAAGELAERLASTADSEVRAAMIRGELTGWYEARVGV